MDGEAVCAGPVGDGHRIAIRAAVAVSVLQHQHIPLIGAADIDRSVRRDSDDTRVLQAGREGLNGEAIRRLDLGDPFVGGATLSGFTTWVEIATEVPSPCWAPAGEAKMSAAHDVAVRIRNVISCS
jgi:hypothetical protein